MDNQEQEVELGSPVLTTESAISKKTANPSRVAIMAWAIFATGVLYYCFAYLLRVYPSVMEPQLLGYFNITASGFGLLTSFYYFIYAPMQLPVGVSVDRIGPRRSLLFACTMAMLGILLFASVKDLSLALIGRLLVGFGAAFAYVTALKLASTWLPPRFFATAAGLVTGCGMIAAIFTDIYLTHSIAMNGFKQAMYFPLSIGAILLVLIFFVIKDKSRTTTGTMKVLEESHAMNFRQLWQYLLLMIKNKQMWLIGIVGALLYLPASVFLDVWAIPYLRYVQHFTPEEAALGVSIMLSGWICSSFISCAISDVIGSRKKPLLVSGVGSFVIACAILFIPGMSLYLIYVLLFFFGLCCGPHPLCFTLSKENNPHHISGTAVAFANFLIMMGGFVFQPIVGNILDGLWQGTTENGIRVYGGELYTIALSLLPVGLLIAAVMTLFIKETYQASVTEPVKVWVAKEGFSSDEVRREGV
ncbi:MAG: MFS transporter [Gammaproteobacteria bacterium RIFCSPHIGHO2_12_FULL_41_15]|nr:MAG: MFS transporter [Gammaproteobacteria bacterium RIFCSPHIGHO2_12_FULL_41_15]